MSPKGKAGKNRNRQQPDRAESSAAYYELKTRAVEDLVTANEENSPPVSPEEIRKYLGSRIGIAEFFGIIFIGFEAVSVLKNMALCGLPVKGLWVKVREFLGKYTDELPDND